MTASFEPLWACLDADQGGSMAVGQLADFTQLEADITSMDGLDVLQGSRTRNRVS